MRMAFCSLGLITSVAFCTSRDCSVGKQSTGVEQVMDGHLGALRCVRGVREDMEKESARNGVSCTTPNAGRGTDHLDVVSVGLPRLTVLRMVFVDDLIFHAPREVTAWRVVTP